MACFILCFYTHFMYGSQTIQALSIDNLHSLNNNVAYLSQGPLEVMLMIPDESSRNNPPA